MAAQWFSIFFENAFVKRVKRLTVMRTEGIAPHYFHAKKGDALIWHANLVHGGSMRRNMQLSRKALVCHFFVKGAFVYHDLAATKSRQQYIGTCLLRDQSGDIRWLPKAGKRARGRAK